MNENKTFIIEKMHHHININLVKVRVLYTMLHDKVEKQIGLQNRQLET